MAGDLDIDVAATGGYIDLAGPGAGDQIDAMTVEAGALIDDHLRSQARLDFGDVVRHEDLRISSRLDLKAR